MRHIITLNPVVSLLSIVPEGELVAFDVGPDKQVYRAFALRRLDYRTTGGGATFPKPVGR